MTGRRSTHIDSAPYFDGRFTERPLGSPLLTRALERLDFVAVVFNWYDLTAATWTFDGFSQDEPQHTAVSSATARKVQKYLVSHFVFNVRFTRTLTKYRHLSDIGTNE